MMTSARLSMSCKNKFCNIVSGISGMGRHLWPSGVSGITFITLWPIFIIYETLLDINMVVEYKMCLIIKTGFYDKNPDFLVFD